MEGRSPQGDAREGQVWAEAMVPDGGTKATLLGSLNHTEVVSKGSHSSQVLVISQVPAGSVSRCNRQ